MKMDSLSASSTRATRAFRESTPRPTDTRGPAVHTRTVISVGTTQWSAIKRPATANMSVCHSCGITGVPWIWPRGGKLYPKAIWCVQGMHMNTVAC